MILLDFLLLIMLIICTIYCYLLNKKVQSLQNSRVEFARMIKELNVGINKTEHNIKIMQNIKKTTSNDLNLIVNKANNTLENLKTLCKITYKIENQYHYSKKTARNNSANDQLKTNDPTSFTNDAEHNLNNDNKNNRALHFQKLIESAKTKQSENVTSSKLRTNELTSNKLSQNSYYGTLRKINNIK